MVEAIALTFVDRSKSNRHFDWHLALSSSSRATTVAAETPTIKSRDRYGNEPIAAAAAAVEQQAPTTFGGTEAKEAHKLY